MTEITEVPKDAAVQAKIGRRTAIKAGIAGAIGTGLGLLGAREIKVGQEGLETQDGIFYPLYERHDIGINASDLPKELDGFFREMPMSKVMFEDTSPGEILNARGKTTLFSVEKDVSFAKVPVIEALAAKGTKIVVGDVDIPANLINSGLDLSEKRALTGLIIGLTGYLYPYVVKKMIDIYQDREAQPKQLARRKLLKSMMVGAGVVLAGPIITSRAAGFTSLLPGMNPGRKNALNRIRNRITGLMEDLSPENHLVFLRNIVMANKILTAAETLGKESGHKPKIAFNVGAAHSGLEDFLVAGHDFTRWLLNHYPKEVLSPVIDNCGGIENFSSLRIFTLPANLTTETLTDPGLDNKIQDTRVVDEELVKMLHDKFRTEEKAAEKAASQEFDEHRILELALILSTLKKYLSPDFATRMEQILLRFALLQPKDYEKMIESKHLRSTSALSLDSFSITLPGNKPSGSDSKKDIRVAVLLRNDGTLESEDISFFQDAFGNIVENPNDPKVVRLTPEQLKPRLISSFQDIPENQDPSFWEYTPPGGPATPEAGQGHLRPKVFEDETSRKSYQISLDGRTALYTYYKPGKNPKS